MRFEWAQVWALIYFLTVVKKPKTSNWEVSPVPVTDSASWDICKGYTLLTPAEVCKEGIVGILRALLQRTNAASCNLLVHGQLQNATDMYSTMLKYRILFPHSPAM